MMAPEANASMPCRKLYCFAKNPKPGTKKTTPMKDARATQKEAPMASPMLAFLSDVVLLSTGHGQ